MEPAVMNHYHRAMKRLALLLLLALPALAAGQRAPDGTPEDTEVSTAAQTPSPPPGSLDSSKIRLDAQDAAGALSDGADAYAARGDAKRALGRPLDEAIADYAQAAKLDPRYIEKWKGLIAQKESAAHPKNAGSKGLNGVSVATMAAVAIIGILLIAAAFRLLHKRSEHPLAPDDEAIKTGGRKNAAGEGTQIADDENPSQKEPLKTAAAEAPKATEPPAKTPAPPAAGAEPVKDHKDPPSRSPRRPA
jgi:tetratricopeptide (TPR) repeat protein